MPSAVQWAYLAQPCVLWPYPWYLLCSAATWSGNSCLVMVQRTARNQSHTLIQKRQLSGISPERTAFRTDRRQTTVSSAQHPVCVLFAKVYGYLASCDRSLFDGHACGQFLQTRSLYHRRGRGYLFSLGGYPFVCKKELADVHSFRYRLG